MAGPAIRAWNLAEVLAGEHEVVMVSLLACDLSHRRFRTQWSDDQGLRGLESWTDVLVVQGGVLKAHPFLTLSTKVIVEDLYIPFHLENLEQTRDMPSEEAVAVVGRLVEVINDELRRGDFFLCATDRQRDFWIGGLAALGRVNPCTYAEESNLRGLIDVVPFGLPNDPPVQRVHGIRGTIPGIGPGDKVIIWAGGVYNWFDPCSLVRAVDQLRRKLPQIRLYFLGTQHPNPHIPAMRVVGELRQLSSDLDLTDRHVFFNDGWVEYAKRADFLLDADVGVSTHLDHVETAYSFRTRILDYLWAGLPMVLTEGDSLADRLRADGVAFTVPPSRPDAIAAALLEALTAPPDRVAVRRAAEQYTWERVAAPLVHFCRSPRRAPDLVAAISWGLAGPVAATTVEPHPPSTVGSRLRALGERTWTSLQADGPLVTWRRAVAYVRRRL
jgi:glycosyltransferase involved in cell wall biosynthesis